MATKAEIERGIALEWPLKKEFTMNIAVASQNRREITDHTGRCRKFWIYKVENGMIANKEPCLSG